MGGAVSLSGNDTVVLNGRVLVGFADADVAELTFPNEIATVKVGKNQNAIFGFNTMGQIGEFKLRLLRACSDDQFLNGLLNGQNNNFQGDVLLTGQFIKKIGDGKGNVASDTYVAANGVFVKQVGAKMNTEGDATQSVAEYMIKFASVVRVIT